MYYIFIYTINIHTMLLKLLTHKNSITHDCLLFHDINGNLLAKIEPSEYYRLDIDKYDNLVFTKINLDSMFDIIDNIITYDTILNVNDNSLKKKINRLY